MSHSPRMSAKSPHPIVKFALDEGMIVHHPGMAGVLFLDASASYCYCIAESSGSDEAVIARLRGDLGGAENDLRPYRSLLAQWRELGLLPYGAEPVRRRRPDVLAELCAPEPLPDAGSGDSADFDILGRAFRIDCPDAGFAEEIGLAFAHLRPKRRFGLRRSGFHLNLRRWGDDCAILGHGREWWRGAPEEALPALKSAMFSIAVDATPYLASVHAAAVARGERAALLAGDSGSGKTLLSLALLRRGYSYLSDDCVLLGSDISARGVPMPISIKRDGMQAAAALAPEVKGLDEHKRHDGQWVRYWAPTGALDRRRLPIGAVCFVTYSAAGPDRAETMSAFSGLRRLATLLQIRRPLRAAELAALVDWATRTTFLEIRFSDAAFVDRTLAALQGPQMIASIASEPMPARTKAPIAPSRM
jgi:hypothetical protein